MTGLLSIGASPEGGQIRREMADLLAYALLSREVHLVLCAGWQSGFFAGIARNDQQQIDEILVLASRSGIDDCRDDPWSVPGLRPLFVELLDWGSQSPETAYLASCYVQELLLEHLGRLIATTSNAALLLLGEELSTRWRMILHITANRYKQRHGLPYQPQVLESLDMTADLHSSHVRI